MNFKKPPTLTATSKPPAPVKRSVKTPLKTPPASNGNVVSEMELTQVDFDDILGASNKKPGATKTTTPMKKHNNETNSKKSSKNGTQRYAVRLVRITPKSPPPPLPLSPPTPPPLQQKETTGSTLKKRQRTRSTAVRHKVSEILANVEH